MKIPEIAIEITRVIAAASTAYYAEDSNAGQAVSNFVKDTIHTLVHEFSSQRQAKRIADVSGHAIKGIRRRFKKGETLRDDGFFTHAVDRSYAAETFESMLLKARDEPEEKKIPYLAKLFENASFDSQIHPGLLHFLCKEFESITYRQLCIIKMIVV